MAEQRVLGHAVHLNVCPECGTTDSGHGLDPPPHCPHEYERFVPVKFAPEARALAAEARLEELEKVLSSLRGVTNLHHIHHHRRLDDEVPCEPDPGEAA